MESNQYFIPYGRQNISEGDIEAVVNVLKSTYLTQGPLVGAFEDAICEKVGSRYGVAANSATSALHIACLALGLRPGDWLWTSPTTFVASANCGLYCGAKIDFVDIQPETGLIDVVALHQKLRKAEECGLLPKVVVAVHLTGASCDMASIASLARQYGFYLLEDASHAIGGKYQDSSVGSCKFSDICVFSFHPVKIITTAEGGLATTNNEDLAHRMALFRSHGIVKDQRHFEYPSSGPWSYEQQMLGFNYRLTDLQAALGLSQLTKLDDVVAQRNLLYENYEKLLSDMPAYLLRIPDRVYSSVHLAVIRLRDIRPSSHHSVFCALRQAGIGVQVHYSPIHLQPFYRSLGFKKGDYPCAEAFATNAISIPLYPGLTEQQQYRVVSCLAKSLGDL